MKALKGSVQGKDFKSLTSADKEALLELLFKRHDLIYGNAFNRGVIFMAGKGLNLLSEQVRHLTEVVITPEHADRTESAEFRHDKERLKADGHFKQGEDPVPQDGEKPEEVLEEINKL